MKTFVEFISECYFFLFEEEKKGRGGPDYNYEHSFANIYNHMVGIDKKNIIKGAVQRGDIATVIDYLAREVNKAQTNPKHPLHFNNAPVDGFTKGQKTEAHAEKYYEKLLDQQYSFLNFIMSDSGRKNFVKHNIARVEGATKIPTTAKYAETSGKKQDTSKVDIRFFDKEGKPAYGLSLKDAKGAVVNSSGADETKTLMMMGVGELLNQQLNDGTITPEQKNELESFVNDNANELALYMASTKGMSKQQQQDALPKMQSYLDKLEQKIPGAVQALSSEAITGKGKFGDADSVDALFSTGRGGEVIEDPRWLAQYIKQRGRLGKGEQKTAEGGQRPTTFSGDIKKDELKAAETRSTDSEWLRNWAEKNKPGWAKQVDKLEPETQKELKGSLESGELDIADFDALVNVDKRLKNFRELRAEMENSKAQYAQTTAELEQQANQANANVSSAQAEVEKANDPSELKYSDGTKPLLQNRKRFQDFVANNPTDPSVKKIVQARQAAEDQFTAAQNAANDAAMSYQTHISTPPTIQPQQPPQPTQPEKPQQPTQTAPQQPQKPIKEKPAPQQPAAPQAASEQPPAPQSTSQQPAPEQPAPEAQQTQAPQQVSPQPEQKKKKQKPPIEISPEQAQ